MAKKNFRFYSIDKNTTKRQNMASWYGDTVVIAICSPNNNHDGKRMRRKNNTLFCGLVFWRLKTAGKTRRSTRVFIRVNPWSIVTAPQKACFVWQTIVKKSGRSMGLERPSGKRSASNAVAHERLRQDVDKSFYSSFLSVLTFLRPAMKYVMP